jgi:nucleoside-diphosphate-sugar epimerase
MFTIFGATGFIGSHLVAALERRAIEYSAPERDDWTSWRGRNLGHVIYAIGITSDFRRRLLDTVRSHVCRLVDVLDHGQFETFLYLSSTRIYGGAERGIEETSFSVDPESASDVYNLSKLMGESLVLTHEGARLRVARLSNVYGPDWDSDNFLISVIRDSVRDGTVTIRTSPDGSKDYVAIDDVVESLISIATRGTHKIYNVGSGKNVTNGEIADKLASVAGCRVDFADGAPIVKFPPINVTRITDEFGLNPRSLLDDLPTLVAEFRKMEEA